MKPEHSWAETICGCALGAAIITMLAVMVTNAHAAKGGGIDDSMTAVALVVLVGAVVAIGCLWWWVATMVNAARHSKWVWAIMVFLVPPLCVLYSLFAWERTPRRAAMSDRVEPRW
jgi:cytochrome bd-type quinol oxidase subunit 2